MKIKNNNIEFIRGDTEVYSIALSDYKDLLGDNEIEENDKIRFGVKKYSYDSEYVVFKEVAISDGIANIVIDPEDTKDVIPDKYIYDIEYKKENGFTKTLIPLSFCFVKADVCV